MLEVLWQRYKYENDSDSREKLVVKCLPLVKSLAQRLAIYASSSCDADDLMSAGIVGLLDALEKYDPVAQTSFRTYAKCRIRGAILDEIRSMKWAPRSVQEKIRDLKKVNSRLEQILSRPPTEEELSSALDMNLEQFRKMLVQIGPSAILLSGLNYDEDNGDRIRQYNNAIIEDTDAINPVSRIISEEVKSILSDAIESLPEKEKIVISLYYYDEMTMRQIGDMLELTESRVCQIHAKAILNLFQALNTKIAPDEISLCYG